MTLPAPAPPPWQQWDLHPSVIIGLVLLGGLYVYWGGLEAPRRRVASFAVALLVLGLALNGPLHNLSDTYLFSAEPRGVLQFARWATRPLAAGVVFSAPITLWHFPQFYEAALEHHPLHIVQHLVFIATAVLMWWPVLSPVPELPRASYPTQLVYLFLLGFPMSLAGAFITLAEGVLYPFYASAPRVWGLTPLADQQLGGLLMWVVGTIYLWVATSVVWFRWSAREERGDVERAVPLEAYGNAEVRTRAAEQRG
jgi:putative membrane protein